MSALYNELDPYAAQWIRNLSSAGHIAPGAVDERSIESLTPADVRGHTQFHTFAGIAVWSHALRLAGVPDDFPVWTGSCPCQPFSPAGLGKGFEDERHLWPVWFRLIDECRPPIVFGEQVASKAGLAWLDLVQTDLEGSGYAFGAAILPAAGVGAPHMRHRLFFVAYATDERREGLRLLLREEDAGRDASRLPEVAGSGAARRLGNPDDTGLEGRGRGGGGADQLPPGPSGVAGGLADADGGQCDRLSDGKERESHGTQAGRQQGHGEPQRGGAPVSGFWGDAEWVPCRDGKARPVEPGTFPLAHGAPARVGRLRAYGNAIVAQAAAAFIRASLSAIREAA